ncbi:histidine kinase [Photobacterium sp. SDRW27]|uniref:sensor histidine kinase n=1 Tax=Photobacterium obscurum TaxID=2829490 RepID=UPI002242D05E|nr:histidine kinase [Photobacterium obscurum]MCW8330234.1 histidine kinase [Photobacterium obscurum]
MGQIEYSGNAFHWLRTVGVTSVFCVVIAVATNFVWPDNFYDDLIISFGYGFSAIVSARLLSHFFPGMTFRQVNILSVSAAMLFGTINAFYWLSDYEHFQSFTQMKPVILLALIFTVVCFYYFYAYEQKLVAQQEMEQAKRKQSEQEKALALSQLQQLQSQIEPHFLFNTLANSIALIDQEPAKAKRMLERLTDLLRTNLHRNRESLTTLEEEVALISAYLDIQQIRLGDRLSYQVTNNGVNLFQCIPPLLLQPLVENAVYYGIEPKGDGGHIELRIEENDSELLLQVIDNGYGIQPEMSSGGHGLGLENIRSRLAALFDKKASLTIKEPAAGGVTATIILPKAQLNTLLKQGEHDG